MKLTATSGEWLSQARFGNLGIDSDVIEDT